MDNILSDWARSPFIPITIHLCTFVPILAHPPIHLPTLATLNSVCLAQILWVIHPYMLSYTLDTHCHPMAPSTQPPTIHIHWLDSQTHLIDVTHVAQGGSWGPQLFLVV